jgi:hypothetical protein
MRTVRDAEGTHYLLVKESGESSLVRDPATGDQRHVPNDDIETVDGESPLETAATVVPATVQRVLTAAHDERALGLLLEIDTRGPVGVRTLLSVYDLCESDLHGLLAEFRAAGLIEETDTTGRRGYVTTDDASDGLEQLRGS